MTKSKPPIFALILTLPLLFFFVSGALNKSDSIAASDGKFITILNPQSTPYLHSNWTVYFRTEGQGELKITNLNPDEVYLELLAREWSGEWVPVDYRIEGNTIYADWSYSDGKIIHRVEDYGSHTLEFEFGNIAYAHNYCIAPFYNNKQLVPLWLTNKYRILGPYGRWYYQFLSKCLNKSKY